MENVEIEISIWDSIAEQISTEIFNEFEIFEENMETLCRASIKNHFQKALKTVSVLIETLFEQESIKIWIDVNDDMGDKRPESLASFDLDRTKHSGKYSFWISSHLVHDTICKEMNLPDTRPMISQTSVWVHELIHMADHRNIKRFRAAMETHQDKYREAQPTHLRLMRVAHSDPDCHMPREWQLLAIFNQFRCEGIAQLHSAMIGLEPLLIADRLQAVEGFRHLFLPVIDFLTRSKTDILPIGLESAWQRHLRLLRDAYYVHGPWLVLDSLSKMGARYESLASESVRAIASGKSLELQKACEITAAVLDMDIGSFLMALTSPSSEAKNNVFIKIDELAVVANFLTVEDAQLGSYPFFMARIIECYMENDRETYIRLLKEIVGYPMDADEIHSCMKRLPEGLKKHGDLSREVIKLYDTIYKRWIRTGDELLAWVITYLLDPEDLIQDESSYLGIIDDLYVMRSGLKLSTKTE